MATWAIGDVHGCYRTLRKLLKKIEFAKTDDRLWFTGDLVNRGPRSLEVLEWAADHDWRIESVLGNHDLHLLAVAFGVAEERPKDTFRPILKSVRSLPLLDWLRRRPLVARSGEKLLVHAGLLPHWSADEVQSIATRLEGRLRSDAAPQLLASLRKRGEESTAEASEIRALTFVRTIDKAGELVREFTGAPEDAPQGCLPWFEVPGRRSAGLEIYFGHWAAAGYRHGEGWFCLDSGCAWGGKLTAIRLEDGALVQVQNAE